MAQAALWSRRPAGDPKGSVRRRPPRPCGGTCLQPVTQGESDHPQNVSRLETPTQKVSWLPGSPTGPMYRRRIAW